jgi:hypothetical protein
MSERLESLAPGDGRLPRSPAGDVGPDDGVLKREGHDGR